MKLKRAIVLAGLAGLLAGVLWLAALRFISYDPKVTHYHANFAVFINGERLAFSEPGYYEEIAACSADYARDPKGRVHMHNRVNDVVHVHDEGVTWGHFLSNIGITVSDGALITARDSFGENEQRNLVFILNGNRVNSIANRVIGNEDRLLVSYDAPTADFDQQFTAVPFSAREVNNQTDPASCSGDEAADWRTRLKAAIGF